MKEIIADTGLIAYCGLYCAACKSYLKGKCQGCQDNVKATWCKVRTCCMEHEYASCVDCTLFENVADCKKLNNLISKFFSLVFGSDRLKCIAAIQEHGLEQYATNMAERGIMSIPRKS